MKESTFEKYKLVIDEYLVNGMNGTKAYQKFYPSSEGKSCDASFRKILENTRIQEYIKEKQQNKALELNIKLEDQLLELSDIKIKAKNQKRYTEAINAIKEQNKLLGFYEVHNKQLNDQPKKDYSKLSDQELITLSRLEQKANKSE